MVVATKTDLGPTKETLTALRTVAEEDRVAYCELSALREEGLEGFVAWVRDQVASPASSNAQDEKTRDKTT